MDGRIAQLRAQHTADQDEKTAEGKAKAKAKAKAKEKTKAGWLVPEEYTGPVTHQEEELGELSWAGLLLASVVSACFSC